MEERRYFTVVKKTNRLVFIMFGRNYYAPYTPHEYRKFINSLGSDFEKVIFIDNFIGE